MSVCLDKNFSRQIGSPNVVEAYLSYKSIKCVSFTIDIGPIFCLKAIKLVVYSVHPNNMGMFFAHNSANICPILMKFNNLVICTFM